MNGALMWLISLILRIANGEGLEQASRADWKNGLSIVVAFCLFGGLIVTVLEAVNPHGMIRTWLVVTGLFAGAFGGWYFFIRRLPVILLVLVGVVGWVIIALHIWR